MSTQNIDLNSVHTVSFNGNSDNVYQVDLVKNGARNIVWRKAAVLPTVTFSVSRFAMSGSGRQIGALNRGKSPYYGYYYRWRVSSYNITNAGDNLRYGDINFTFTSNQQIFAQPSITANITNGKLTSLNITNGGQFEGTRGNADGLVNASIAGYASSYTNHSTSNYERWRRGPGRGSYVSVNDKYWGEASPTGVNDIVSYTGTN